MLVLMEGSDPRFGFAERLRALKNAVGVSFRTLEIESERTLRRRPGSPPLRLRDSTIEGMISSTNPVCPKLENFEVLIDTCLRLARQDGRILPDDLNNRDIWDKYYRELLENLAKRRSGHRAALEAAGQMAQMAARPATPRQLPPAIRGFVGRAAEQERLSALLAENCGNSPAVMIAMLTGSPGVGKTALAVHWAHTVGDRFPDGTLYLDLRGHGGQAPRAPEEVLEEFLRDLDVPLESIPAELDARARLFRSVLHRRRMLIVLDDAASAEQVLPLLPASPGCAVIVTSRNRLSQLAVRQGACSIPVGLLPAPEATELLRLIVGESRTRTEPKAAADLVGKCAGLPLALRIVAERLAVHTHLDLADIAAELAAERGRLAGLEAEDASVRTAFALSHRSLPADTARVFRLLAMHPGPDLTSEPLGALTGLGAARARRQLDRLAKAHLLEETGRDLYRFHDLLRCYAAELLNTDGDVPEQESAERRLLAWYAHSAAAADSMLGPYGRNYQPSLDAPPELCHPKTFGSPQEAIRWYRAERANLVAGGGGGPWDPAREAPPGAPRR